MMSNRVTPDGIPEKIEKTEKGMDERRRHHKSHSDMIHHKLTVRHQSIQTIMLFVR